MKMDQTEIVIHALRTKPIRCEDTGLHDNLFVVVKHCIFKCFLLTVIGLMRENFPQMDVKTWSFVIKCHRQNIYKGNRSNAFNSLEALVNVNKRIVGSGPALVRLKKNPI